MDCGLDGGGQGGGQTGQPKQATDFGGERLAVGEQHTIGDSLQHFVDDFAEADRFLVVGCVVTRSVARDSHD